MSAYMVEDDTINKVLAWLEADAYSSQRRHATWVMKEAGYDCTNKEHLAGLGLSMFGLNVLGVEARYGEGQAAEFRELNYKYAEVRTPEAIPALKALQCLIYQCSEGNVAETALYKLLEALQSVMACAIVAKLPAWDAAAWG